MLREKRDAEPELYKIRPPDADEWLLVIFSSEGAAARRAEEIARALREEAGRDEMEIEWAAIFLAEGGNGGLPWTWRVARAWRVVSERAESGF